MVWVIAFVDVKEEYYRYELYDDDGNFKDYGMVCVFNSKEEAEMYIKKYTDSNAYDFYAKEITEQDRVDYEAEMKGGSE